MTRVPSMVCAWLICSTTALSGQALATELGAQGTAVYNVSWVRTTDPPVSLARGVARYGGRVALRMAPQWYVGAGVASWQLEAPRTSGVPLPPGAYDELVTSVVLSLYGQYYPWSGHGLFARAGAGVATDRNYQPAYTVIDGYTVLRFALSGGVGFDIPVQRHLALTVSGDLVSLADAGRLRESASAVLVGFGVTLH